MRNLILLVVIQLLSVSICAGPVDREIDLVMREYSKIHASLTQDKTTGVDSAAQSIVKITSDVNTTDAKVLPLMASIRKAAQTIQGKDLSSARIEFFELSKPLLAYVYQFYSGEQKYYRFYCDMAKKGWVQDSENLRNPYYGSSMLTCGELIE